MQVYTTEIVLELNSRSCLHHRQVVAQITSILDCVLHPLVTILVTPGGFKTLFTKFFPVTK